MSRVQSGMTSIGGTTERDLEGKIALVTGGGRGIGRAVSLSLAERGANVVIAYLRKRAAAEEVCAAIEGVGVKATALRANVGDEDDIDRLFDSVAEMYGRLDVFISNAATGVIRGVRDLDARAWGWTMDANARALLLGAKRAERLMDGGGSIVAVSSLGARRVMPGYAVVGASKAAVEALVRYLAVEFAPSVRVNAVSPGVVDTDALSFFGDKDAIVARARAATPAGELATPADVAAAVMFLTSAAAAKVTGHILTIDGGAELPA